jgi:hypothetical protein
MSMFGREIEDFPWFMLCLFMMILALYGMVVQLDSSL